MGPGRNRSRALPEARPSPGGEIFQSFLRHVAGCSGRADRRKLVDAFWAAARLRGIPLIEGNSVVFLYRGKARAVHLAGDGNGWKPEATALARVAGTDLFYFQDTYEPDARLDYKYVIDRQEWILDPENGRQCPGGRGPNSELAMPGYRPARETEIAPDVPRGRVEEFRLHDRHAGASYPVSVYLPAGYDRENPFRYPAVYFQDGSDYIHLGAAIQVLDNLIHSGRVAPLIAIFVTPIDRGEDYVFTRRERYETFFVRHLVPYVDRHYPTRRSPGQRAVLGDSFAANISAVISYRHPRLFGNCGLQSPAFWPEKWETQDLLLDGPPKRVRFFIAWGRYELRDDVLRRKMAALVEGLRRKGYEVACLERPEGHSWGLWRATLAEMLVNLVPPASAGRIESKNRYCSGDRQNNTAAASASASVSVSPSVSEGRDAPLTSVTRIGKKRPS